MLNVDDFMTVVRLTPLISIDLIVTDGNRRVLVGHRRNRPAQGTWFVPGGRVDKDESLDAAFKRVVSNELGVASVERSSSRFMACSSIATTITSPASPASARTTSCLPTR